MSLLWFTAQLLEMVIRFLFSSPSHFIPLATTHSISLCSLSDGIAASM